MYYIYKIENLVNHKKYIGLTNNIRRRYLRHFSDLKRGCHDNSFLQKEYNIYGKENFSFEEIFCGDISAKEIGEKEKYYIKFYDSFHNGYNQNEGGDFGPANGGSHLIETDILNILSVLEFMSRPGQILSDMYGVSKTTISRIKHGENHSQYKEKYEKMPVEQRKAIYELFCETTNFYEQKVNTTIIATNRRMTKEQVFMVLANEEFGRPIPLKRLARWWGVQGHALQCILKGVSYKDYVFEYNKLRDEKKEEIVSLLRNQQQQTS